MIKVCHNFGILICKMSSNKRKIEAQNDTPSKRKVNWLSLSEKLEVIKRSDEGATCSKTAKDKNVPDSTVRRILKNNFCATENFCLKRKTNYVEGFLSKTIDLPFNI